MTRPVVRPAPPVRTLVTLDVAPGAKAESVEIPRGGSATVTA